MSKSESPFYPPRARWRGPFWTLRNEVRRQIALRGIRLPGPIAAPALFALAGSLLVPGLAFYLRGSRLWGKLAMGTSAFLLIAFLIWLGYPAGNIAFGLLLSIHCSSLVYFFEPQLVDEPLSRRMLASVVALLVLAGFVYMPVRHMLQQRCFMPMNVHGHVVIVRAYASSQSVRQGDWIAYSLKGNTDEVGIYVHGGFGLGPVLATGGDQVKFGKTAFEVNGVPMPRQARMPDSGELVVPENSWFVWPELNISYGHGFSEAAISATVLRMAVITKGKFIGTPFKRWFWRRQILS